MVKKIITAACLALLLMPTAGHAQQNKYNPYAWPEAKASENLLKEDLVDIQKQRDQGIRIERAVQMVIDNAKYDKALCHSDVDNKFAEYDAYSKAQAEDLKVRCTNMANRRIEQAIGLLPAAERWKFYPPSDPRATKPTNQGGSIDKATRQRISEAIGKAVGPCFLPVGGAKSVAVTFIVWMNQDGTPIKAEMKDTGRYNSDPTYRAAADAAHRAIMNPRCQPWPLPPEHYDAWKTLTINFKSNR